MTNAIAQRIAQQAIADAESLFHDPCQELRELIRSVNMDDLTEEDAQAILDRIESIGTDLQRRYEAQGAQLGALLGETGRMDAIAQEQARLAERRILADDGEGLETSHKVLLRKAQDYLRDNPPADE